MHLLDFEFHAFSKSEITPGAREGKRVKKAPFNSWGEWSKVPASRLGLKKKELKASFGTKIFQ
jgi:hypothetical protein